MKTKVTKYKREVYIEVDFGGCANYFWFTKINNNDFVFDVSTNGYSSVSGRYYFDMNKKDIENIIDKLTKLIE